LETFGFLIYFLPWNRDFIVHYFSSLGQRSSLKKIPPNRSLLNLKPAVWRNKIKSKGPWKNLRLISWTISINTEKLNKNMLSNWLATKQSLHVKQAKKFNTKIPLFQRKISCVEFSWNTSWLKKEKKTFINNLNIKHFKLKRTNHF
jgi:hypothetical protein